MYNSYGRNSNGNSRENGRENSSRNGNGGVAYEIIKNFGIISGNERTGWNLEVNLVSWNGGNPKIDIRSWNSDHSKCGKGISIAEIEAVNLRRILGGVKMEGKDLTYQQAKKLIGRFVRIEQKRAYNAIKGRYRLSGASETTEIYGDGKIHEICMLEFQEIKCERAHHCLRNDSLVSIVFEQEENSEDI